MVFARDDEEGEPPSIVALPTNEHFRDFSARMAEAVMRVADVEQVSPQDIVRKIQSAEQDNFSLSLLLPPHEHPSLEVTSSLFQGLRNLIMYGACMEHVSKRHFDRAFKVGKEQAQHFQFAHTFQGSFGLTIESQLTESQGQHQSRLSWGNDSFPPLQRRVLERITRGFSFARIAQQKQDSEEISQHFEQGFNANMCEAVVDMLQDIHDIQIVYSVSWSCHLPPSQDVAQIHPILLEQETSRYLQQAAQYLKKNADKDLEEDKILEGHIISLSSEKPTERTITILTEEWGKVSFSAQPSEYTAACNAHGEGQVISVKGKLTKQGKRKPWALLHPHDFHFE